MKRRLWAAVLLLALVAAGIVAVFVNSARQARAYPTTPEGWAARWEAAAAEFGRTPGEGWDVWLEVFAELDTATDPDRVAALTDRLRPIERFTMPVPDGIGTMAAWEQGTDTIGRTRRPVVEVIVPAMHDALMAGDFAGAADWLERAWALARVADASGTIIGGMVQTAIISAMYQSLRPHLPALAESEYVPLWEAIDEPPTVDPQWSLRIERELGLGAIQEAMAVVPLMAKDQLRLFEEALIDWSLYESAGDAEAHERVRQLAARLDGDSIYRRRRMALDTVLPALGRVGPALRAGLAERDATRVMLALESYRTDLGQYPDTLDALVPQYIDQLPPDPHRATESFVYRVVDPQASDPAAAYVLYSIGADRVDDGGRWPDDWRANPLTSASASGDHLFNRPRPQPPAEPEDDPEWDPEDDPSEQP